MVWACCFLQYDVCNGNQSHVKHRTQPQGHGPGLSIPSSLFLILRRRRKNREKIGQYCFGPLHPKTACCVHSLMAQYSAPCFNTPQKFFTPEIQWKCIFKHLQSQNLARTFKETDTTHLDSILKLPENKTIANSSADNHIATRRRLKKNTLFLSKTSDYTLTSRSPPRSAHRRQHAKLPLSCTDDWPKIKWLCEVLHSHAGTMWCTSPLPKMYAETNRACVLSLCPRLAGVSGSWVSSPLSQWNRCRNFLWSGPDDCCGHH